MCWPLLYLGVTKLTACGIQYMYIAEGLWEASINNFTPGGTNYSTPRIPLISIK